MPRTACGRITPSRARTPRNICRASPSTKIASEWKDAELQAILDRAGIRPQESVTGLDPKYTILRCRERTFTGAAEKTFGKGLTLVGFTTLAGEVGKSCVLDFGREAYVYETDAGYIGKVARLELAKLEKPFKLYSLFDVEQQPPAIGFADGTAARPEVAPYHGVGADVPGGPQSRRNCRIKPGDYISISTAALRPHSVYRLMVKRPDGKEITNREEVFCFDGKERKCTLQFPYSDESGVYTVTLRDIATGLESSIEVTLSK